MTALDSHWPAWMEDAACATIGGDVWFPDAQDATWTQARNICRSCDALPDCAAWVMAIELGRDHKHRFGIVAAMSPLQRTKYEPQWLLEQDGSAA